MNPEQSSISIINKNNGQVSGESASALPIKLVDSDIKKVRIKYFCFGVVASVALFIFFVFIARQQVVVVDVSGKAPEYQEYQLK